MAVPRFRARVSAIGSRTILALGIGACGIGCSLMLGDGLAGSGKEGALSTGNPSGDDGSASSGGGDGVVDGGGEIDGGGQIDGEGFDGGPDAPIAPPTETCDANGEVDEEAPWPLVGGCASNIQQSKLLGPSVTPVVKWSKENAGASFFGPPALGKNAIYLGAESGSGVVAYSYAGDLLWGATVANSCCGGIAIAKSGNLLAGTSLALSLIAPSGSVVRNYPGDGEHDSAPVIGPNGNVYYATLANGSGNGALIAVDPTATALRWKKTFSAGVATAPGVTKSGRVVVATVTGALYMYDANGAQVWTTLTGLAMHAPMVIATTAIYNLTDSGLLVAYSQEGGLKWSYSTNSTAAVNRGPAVRPDGVIYVPAGDGLVALKPDGSVLWKYATPTAVTVSPTIDAEGTVYFATLDGFVYAATPSGGPRWSPMKINGTAKPRAVTIGPSRHLYVTTGSTPGIQDLGAP